GHMEGDPAAPEPIVGHQLDAADHLLGFAPDQSESPFPARGLIFEDVLGLDSTHQERTRMPCGCAVLIGEDQRPKVYAFAGEVDDAHRFHHPNRATVQDGAEPAPTPDPAAQRMSTTSRGPRPATVRVAPKPCADPRDRKTAAVSRRRCTNQEAWLL